MNIVFITKSLGFGGAEKMITFVANSMSERGHKCGIVNMNDVGDYINTYKREVKENVLVRTLAPVPNKKNKNIYFIQEIYAFAKEFQADIIIGFTSFPNFYAKIVSFMLHIPSIISERGDPSRVGNVSTKDKIIMAFINRSKGGVFQTEGAMDYYGKGLQKRGIVIPNPIFLNGNIPNIKHSDREKSVVCVGRLDNFQKRYDIMLKAFQIFSAKHPEYMLKLYGRGNDEEQIMIWANELGISEKVELMGISSTPMQDIVRDGMFLNTSDFEGISNSLLEAMAVGLPCVSTDHTPGGARFLIKDHKNGLLAPVQDCEGLANAMSEFVDKPDLAELCGEQAKDVVNRFAPKRIIDMWEKYILDLCEK